MADSLEQVIAFARNLVTRYRDVDGPLSLYVAANDIDLIADRLAALPKQDDDDSYLKAVASAGGLMDRWQPIATAPRDGTRIITWAPNDTDYTHKMSINQFRNRTLGGGAWAKNAQYKECQPTHWMPLPPRQPWPRGRGSRECITDHRSDACRRFG